MPLRHRSDFKQAYKGRVALRGDIVKDEVFSRQSRKL